MPLAGEQAPELRQHERRDAHRRARAGVNAVGEDAEGDCFARVEPDDDPDRLAHSGEPMRVSEYRTRPCPASCLKIAHASHSTPACFATAAANCACHQSAGWMVTCAFSPFGRCLIAG